MTSLFAGLAARQQQPPANPFATHPNDDPDHGMARAARGWYAGRIAEIRNDPMTSDLAKARALAAAHEQHVKDMAEAHGRLTARRQARLDYLNGLVPSGPDIPEGTSPADRAVLLTAWRAANDAVRNAPSRQARAALLADAQRYGDDIMQRAVLTHAQETGDLGAVDRWVQDTHGVKGWQAETGQLRGALAGQREHAPWDYLDFHTEQPPKEVSQLPTLEAAAGAAGEAA
ncbi:hypothetical protein VSR01_01365 [Actinacidiphila sp. DG2A-62]|uniref:hypothetical protein n=1 Tax=Actinacidiphila sp. DG2A-62 TaxID=3108821 RepID=UPI002DBAFDF4|nr:hypothetical protein [Actinacidiphila sp. DG2A-62]MEC3992264.1 hypothetical protein [Actinacidiphila sp. DG2A-62]